MLVTVEMLESAGAQVDAVCVWFVWKIAACCEGPTMIHFHA